MWGAGKRKENKFSAHDSSLIIQLSIIRANINIENCVAILNEVLSSEKKTESEEKVFLLLLIKWRGRWAPKSIFIIVPLDSAATVEKWKEKKMKEIFN